ncbi:MAG TPA: LacI family DNA-binding transcriptional regulator [Prosthecobacter sp.]|nr:LacI family DNA-binding transcriptional regulator [Prosthecobacter sp.]
MSQTLQAIATLANVSVSTASRALNGHPAISRATVDRVRRAAEQLHYKSRRLHGSANGQIRQAPFKTVAVMSLGMDRSLMTLPINASVISGAERALAELGVQVQLGFVPDVDHPPGGHLRHKPDGLILAGALQGEMLASSRSELMQHLRLLPTVWAPGRPRGCWGDAVASDDYQTGAAAAKYLIEHGHRRLAFLNPKPDHLLFQRREDGFVAMARRLGVDAQSFCKAPKSGWHLPLPAPQTVEAVQDLVDALIACKPRPTAIFAAADSVAALVYRALAVRNLRVGRDISVISANHDASIIAGLHPRLTTFDVQASEIGRLAVKQLTIRMTCPPDLPECELLIAPKLVEGESVARLKKPEGGKP